MPSRKAPVFRRDTPPMRIEFRVAKFAGNSLFEFLRDEVLQTFGFLVQFVYTVIEYAKKECLDEPVMANNFKSSISAGFREPDTSMRLVLHERLIGGSELLQHVRD